jgi:hypothetical protein
MDLTVTASTVETDALSFTLLVDVDIHVDAPFVFALSSVYIEESNHGD